MTAGTSGTTPPFQPSEPAVTPGAASSAGENSTGASDAASSAGAVSTGAVSAGDTTLAASARHISVAYRTEPVVYNASFDVPRGIVMGIIGPNGAGKSTVIKAMMGIVTPLSGETQFFGQPLSKMRSKIAYMPQSKTVDWDFPTTVFDVVKMGTYGSLGWLRRPGNREKDIATAALAQVDMSEFAGRQIGELSGGQRQRVFLARALAQQADIYFMDEPFQGVDAKSQRSIVNVLHQLRAAGKTVVMVHHDLATVSAYCDWVTLINRTIIATGPTESTFTDAAIRATFEIPDDAEMLHGLSADSPAATAPDQAQGR